MEGANSFITAEARASLQEKGIIIIRDASANKCGVISSSYEIIANLLMTDEEFLAHKEEYVASVLKILEKRAVDEARLIFRRHREMTGASSSTDISDSLSTEMKTEHSAMAFAISRDKPSPTLIPDSSRQTWNPSSFRRSWIRAAHRWPAPLSLA